MGFRSSLLALIFLIILQLTAIYCKRSFIVVAPKELFAGNKETIHVTVLDVDTPGTVSVKLLNSTGLLLSETNQPFEKEGSQKVILDVPSHLSSEQQFNDYRLQVSGVFGDYVFDKNETINVKQRDEIVFISTDKPFYKAGQTIKFRILIVNSDLKQLEEAPVGNVWITDSNRIRVAQWNNVTFENGFLHQELKLPEEPVLGNWNIYLQINKLYKIKRFSVKEYVLPTFDVKITPPSSFFFDQQNVTWTVCAKYIYGKPVLGKLKTELKLSQVYYGKPGPTLRKEEEISGCKDVTADLTPFTEDNYQRHRGLHLLAEVIEDGTDTKITATSNVYPSSYEYSISREDSLQYFRAGIPFRTKIMLRKADKKPVVDEIVKICAVMKRENWKKNRQIVDNSNVCKNYKSDEEGNVIFTIPPQPSNTLDVSVEVKSGEINTSRKPVFRFNLTPWYSATGHNLQIEPLKSAVQCGSEAEFSVIYTSKESETRKVYYQVTSKGDIVDDGILTYTFDPSEDLASQTDETYLDTEHEIECQGGQTWDSKFTTLNHIGKFTLKLKVDFKMSPRARLVIYSINEEGNIFADSVSFEIKPCFKNLVQMKFSEERQFPGEKITIHLSAAPKSICSVGIVDKSIYLLEEGDVLTQSKVYDQIRYLETSEYTRPYQRTPDYEYCAKKSKTNGEPLEPLGYVDSAVAFTRVGVLVITDLELETRPCKPSFTWSGRYGTRSCLEHGPSYIALSAPQSGGFGSIADAKTSVIQPSSSVGLPGVPQSTVSLDRGGGVSNEPTSTVRVYFPETWLWNLQFVNKDGDLFFKENMPDSITEWEGTSVCLHPEEGLGISEPVSIVGFQPFFTSTTLPYSIVRGEIMPVIVTVFNYMKECLPININLDQTEDFELHNGTLSTTDCVCGGKSTTKRFFIKPKTLGDVNITVSAATIKDEDVCGNFDVADIKRSDSLTKPLVVLAEGFPKEETKNTFFCMEDTNEGTFKAEHEILHREDMVEGSDRAYISVTGDVMGPTLEGLERLVRVPTGCGEQNMITLVPNIVILDYLKNTNRLSEKIKKAAISNINAGYMRQQNYRHFDGSYSAFGKHDRSGSMWLTAFVVRSFASAARYIDVDEDALAISRNWIISHQQENGCFPVIGMLHNKQMKGGVGKTSPAGLTAYVLTTLLLSGDVNSTVIAKAKQCVEADNNPGDYALSIFAFMAALANDSDAETYLEKLYKNAVDDGFNRYWENKDKSIAIETASYAILTLLRLHGKDHFSKSGPVARWLNTQRNAFGGFFSTQDTIMAIQALAEYAIAINKQPLNMGVAVKGNDLDEIFQLNEGNELLTQRIRVPTLPTGVEIEARGSGCALVQMVHRYNIPNSEESENFILSVQSQKKPNQCRTVGINICASLSKTQNESNMVVLEVKMVSGFSVIKSTVSDLLNIAELEMKRFEVKDNQLNLYFTQLTHQNRCFSFDVEQEIVVEDIKPAIAKIYDYYDQGEMSSVSYTIDDKC